MCEFLTGVPVHPECGHVGRGGQRERFRQRVGRIRAACRSTVCRVEPAGGRSHSASKRLPGAEIADLLAQPQRVGTGRGGEVEQVGAR